MATISPFGNDGNPKILRYSPTIASIPHLFSPFDINVKENMLPLSYCSTCGRYHIFNQYILPMTGWTILG
jgi:hypothetical protein